MAHFRLVHGVTVAAVALLALKAIAFLASPETASTPAPAPPSGEKQDFARALSRPRADLPAYEPTTTGSLDTKPKAEPNGGSDTTSAAIPTPPAPPLVAPSATEKGFLDRLSERREEMQQRSREMETREKLLQEQERRLEERLGQMKAAEEAQKGGVSAKSDSQSPELKNLVTMYETMKPKDAARVFDRLPLDILVSVVTQMNSRKMSEILAVMAPEGAQKLTIALAKRARGGDDRVAAAGAALPPGELPAIEPVPGRREGGLIAR